MREIIYKVFVECEEDIRLGYTLYREETEGEVYYSLEITECRAEIETDRIFLEDVCRSPDGAYSLTELFKRERVTPCTALYILEELLPI